MVLSKNPKQKARTLCCLSRTTFLQMTSSPGTFVQTWKFPKAHWISRIFDEVKVQTATGLVRGLWPVPPDVHECWTSNRAAADGRPQPETPVCLEETWLYHELSGFLRLYLLHRRLKLFNVLCWCSSAPTSKKNESFFSLKSICFNNLDMYFHKNMLMDQHMYDSHSATQL